MTVEVVTVFAPDPAHPKWRDYLPLMALQKQTAERFGHRHTVVTDAHLPGFDSLLVPLSDDVMPAMIEGVIARLRRPPYSYLVFVDADCLIARDLHQAFGFGDFELGLTVRDDPVAPINNGAMYVTLGAAHLSAAFFDDALARCGTHWGADQEAISAVAAPIPNQVPTVELRGALRVGFLSMRSHNVVPKAEGVRHKSDPFVVHFKGETKAWAQTYAERFIL